MKHLENLVQLNGVPGFEREVGQYLEATFNNYKGKIVRDRIGGIFFENDSPSSSQTKIAIVGHQDEVGMIITNIRKNGLLDFQTLGGIDVTTLVASQVILFDENTKINGIISSIPPHLLKEDNKAQVKVSDLCIDIGARDCKSAADFGVYVGMPATFHAIPFYTQDKSRFFAKSIDNRYGCALALDALEHLSKKDIKHRFFFGATVQEEVGLRGANTFCNLIKPDFTIVVDASPANDLLDDKEFGQLGKGFLLRFIDPGMIMNPKLHQFIELEAKRNKIQFQKYVSKGNTDASIISYALSGVPTIVIGIPARYIHSGMSVIDCSDYYAALEMTKFILDLLNSKTESEIINNDYFRK